MSASKARMQHEIDTLKIRNRDLHLKLVRLLAYMINMQDDHPDFGWPDLPDNYDEMVWRYVA